MATDIKERRSENRPTRGGFHVLLLFLYFVLKSFAPCRALGNSAEWIAQPLRAKRNEGIAGASCAERFGLIRVTATSP
jgi:hypothetical protein